MQAAQEKLEGSEERARELYDCNKRLEDHIHDLESRKRAPLYQKKQVSHSPCNCLDLLPQSVPARNESRVASPPRKHCVCCVCRKKS